MYYHIIISFILFSLTIQAKPYEVAKIDSLIKELSNEGTDTNYVNVLYQLSVKLYQVDSEKGIEYGLQALELANKLDWEEGRANILISIGTNYLGIADYTNAIKYYEKSLLICKKLNLKSKIAILLTNMGVVYSNQSNYIKALEKYFEALEINATLNKEKESARIYGNIGVIYTNQANYKKAIEYYLKSIEIIKKSNTLESIKALSLTLGNIGVVYNNQNNLDSALKYYKSALELNKNNNLKNSPMLLGNIGVIYFSKSEYDKAIEYYTQALELDKVIGNKLGIARHLGNLGSVYLDLSQESESNTFNQNPELTSIQKSENLTKSIKLLKQSLDLLNEIGESEVRIIQLINLAQAYSLKGDFKKQSDYLMEYINVKDSVFSQKSADELTKLQLEHEQIVRLREEEETLRIQQEKNQQRNTLQYLAIGSLVIIMGIFLILSGKLSLKEWQARALVFLTFIFAFEFILVMIDSWTDDISEGIPFIKFAINLGLALIIFPMHQYFEKRVSLKVVKPDYLSIEKILEEFRAKNKK